MKKIMILEDEEMVRLELKEFLEKQGFFVYAPDRLPGEELFQEKPDLILLDIGLGEENGIKVCQNIRKTQDIPIIFVTGQNTAESEIQGFLAGGDDYIRKPYHSSVLLLRIQSILERNKEKLTVEGVELDLVFGKLEYKGEVFDLSKKEQQILFCLFKNYPRIVGRDELIEYLWENKLFVDENILNVNLSRIRKRLEGTALSGFLRTVPRKGWQIGWCEK